jgi:hypothetical protein
MSDKSLENIKDRLETIRELLDSIEDALPEEVQRTPPFSPFVQDVLTKARIYYALGVLGTQDGTEEQARDHAKSVFNAKMRLFAAVEALMRDEQNRRLSLASDTQQQEHSPLSTME